MLLLGGCQKSSLEKDATIPTERKNAEQYKANSAMPNEKMNDGEAMGRLTPGYSGKIDQKMFAGTDVASFYLFHPKDLEHRLTSPTEWTNYHFACEPEFEAGRMVAFITGSDGTYSFRITDGPLTTREQKWLASSWEFRYTVRHQRVFLDGGWALPNDEMLDKPEDIPDGWISIPNGNYKVTVNAIEWYSEPGAVDEDGRSTDQALTSYVIQFAPMSDLAQVNVTRVPLLVPSKKRKAREFSSSDDHEDYDEEEGKLAQHYVTIIHRKEVAIPGSSIHMEVTEQLHSAVFGNKGAATSLDRFVLVASDQLPCVGAVVRPISGGKSSGGPFTLSVSPQRLVLVTALDRREPWPMGTVKPLTRVASQVSEADIQKLKRSFSAYGKSNELYRKRIEYPDFEIERVSSMRSASRVTHALIHYVDMPNSTRTDLLQLSDAERVQRLLDILKKKLSLP